MDKNFLRSLIFRHLDGVVTAPVLATLASKGILHYILENKKITLNQLSNQFQTNEGYLNIALRVLASQNMLTYQIDQEADLVILETNNYSERAFSNLEIYKDLYEFLKLEEVINRKDFSDDFCNKWAKLFDKYETYLLTSNQEEYQEKALHFQICKHIEGVLISPLIVRLGMSGLFHKYFMEASFSASEFHKNPQAFEKILDRLVKLDWFKKVGKNYQFTETGLFFARRASAYGVTVSYLPMFSNLEDLMYGSPLKIRELTEGEDEKHVDREMNVWGSGGAHATYFKVIDEFIMDIFNRPLEEQPKGILDMGCGNGALLQHLYEVIERYTLRGRHLDDYPLFLVGADYNEAALKITRANLINNDIWAKVIWGDIGDPDRLSKDLLADYNIALDELLNIRTFLDHNRIWNGIEKANFISDSTGAYAYRGKRLANNLVEESLKQHLENWAPYVKRYGLLLIELHTIAPNLTASNLGKTAATAYDATHGFSDQYILEVDVFHRICSEAGLNPDEKLFKKFPNNNLATVSINYLKG